MQVSVSRTMTAAFVAVTILIAARSAQGQWTYVDDNELAYHGIADLDFVNDSLGIAVGFRSILKTTDGGRSWQISDTLTFKGRSLHSVTVDSTIVGIVAVVVGSDLTIGRSSNIGASWSIVHTNLSATLNKVCQRGNGDYRAFGDGAWLGESTDNALSWDTRLIFPSADLTAATCLDDGTIWAGGFWNDGGGNQCCGVLMKSEDGGESWQVKLRPSDPNDGRFYAVQFLSDDFAYALSSSPTSFGRSQLWRSLDGGENWERVATRQPSRSMLFLDEDFGLVGGLEGKISVTEDGGTSWRTDTLGLALNVTGIYRHPNAILATNDAGIWRNETLVSTASEDITGGATVPTDAGPIIEVFPNPATSIVTFRLGDWSADADPRNPFKMKLVDVLGRPVRAIDFRETDRSATISIAELPAGLYFYRLGNWEGGFGSIIVSGR